MQEVKEIQFYTVKDVMQMLGIKQTKAYEIIRRMNDELEEMGKLTINGKVNKKYFDEKIYR
jgi:prophage antirepressor-like protein